MEKKMKFIFVTGGVVSSLGKGISAACIGRLLKRRGLNVFSMKLDPYLNIDPGTMSPYQHGEVFVTKDGAETDLDLGHYERIINTSLTKESSVTSGKVYSAVLEKERRGVFLGATIQIIPHITNEIKARLFEAFNAKGDTDVCIVEIGGTVGDIESLPFLEAIRQLRRELGYENTFFVHNTLVPYLKTTGEIQKETFSLCTQSGISQIRYLNREGNRIQMTMGKLNFSSKNLGLSGPDREAVHEFYNFGGEEYDCTCVSSGNPHCVIVLDKTDRETVCRIGKYSERAESFPEGINTEILEVLDKNNIQIEIFERGAGYTLASATGACAAAGAAYRRGLIDSDVMVHMPGGKLWTQIDEEWAVKTIGSVKRICKIQLFEDFFQGI